MDMERCINCMESIEEGTRICPHCRYDQKTEQSPFCMKPDTILWGRYLVGRLLGQGGFGMTYVGFDLKLESRVAVKEYFPMGSATRNSTMSSQVQYNTTLLNGDQWREGCAGFLKEARRMEKMNALSNVVRVRDTFEANGTAYIVMDFIEGETLKEKLVKSGGIPCGECMELLGPLMKSLVKIHEKGLIHRDISPDNIMVRTDGSACLLDFGTAKDISFGQSASQQVTKKGFSPLEQYQTGGRIGPWTDVYAMCATIYYCVTGKLVPDAMDRVDNDKIESFPAFEKAVGKTVASAVAEGLKLRSEERIQSMGELLERLRGETQNPGPKPDPEPDLKPDPEPDPKPDPEPDPKPDSRMKKIKTAFQRFGIKNTVILTVATILFAILILPILLILFM